jgi:hypothetical protein
MAIPVNESVAKDLELFCQVLSVSNDCCQVIHLAILGDAIGFDYLMHLPLADA